MVRRAINAGLFRLSLERSGLCGLGLAAVLAGGSVTGLIVAPGFAQAPAASGAAAATRVVGSVVSVDGQKVTVKDQAGTQTTVTVADSTKLVRIAPGQTSLASAEPITLTDLQPGDRVLVRVQAGDAAMTAVSLVAMKQADIAQQHEKVQAAWQHGVGGLVKSVDVENKSITVASNGPTATMMIKLGPAAMVKRYAPESVQYEQAQPSSIDKVMVGDQLRARGTANPDHSFVADEVVVGSFRNLSGKVTAVDTQAGTVSFVDLATKQPVTLKVTGDTQLRKLDDATAEKLAAGMKSGGGGAPGGTGSGGGGKPGGAPSAAAGVSGNAGPAAHGMSEQGSMRPAGGAPGGGTDMQQALAKATAIHLSDVKKNDFVMVVASSSADNQLGAVTMVSNVEPLLRASPNGSAAALSSWSMGGGVPGGQQ